MLKSLRQDEQDEQDLHDEDHQPFCYAPGQH
jgi:hypothetical protein